MALRPLLSDTDFHVIEVLLFSKILCCLTSTFRVMSKLGVSRLSARYRIKCFMSPLKMMVSSLWSEWLGLPAFDGVYNIQIILLT